MLTAKALGEGMSAIQRKITKYNSEKQIEKMVTIPHVSILRGYNLNYLLCKIISLRLYLYHSYGQYIFILINSTCLPDFLTFFFKKSSIYN